MTEETWPGFLANYKIVRPGPARLGPARPGPARIRPGPVDTSKPNGSQQQKNCHEIVQKNYP